MHHRHPLSQLKGALTPLIASLTTHSLIFSIISYNYNNTLNTNFILTLLNIYYFFVTLNLRIYLLNFSLTTIPHSSDQIINSMLKLTTNRLPILLLTLDTTRLSLSRRTTQHRVAQHPIANTRNTYSHATRVCFRRRTIYLWMAQHPSANNTNTYRNTLETLLITSTQQSETLMTHLPASTSTTQTTNPVHHRTFGPAYSSDNAGDGPPSKRPTKEFFTSYTDHDLTNPTFQSNVIIPHEYLCDIIYDIIHGSTTLKENYDTSKQLCKTIITTLLTSPLLDNSYITHNKACVALTCTICHTLDITYNSPICIQIYLTLVSMVPNNSTPKHSSNTPLTHSSTEPTISSSSTTNCEKESLTDSSST